MLKRWIIIPAALVAVSVYEYQKRAMRRVHSPHKLYKTEKTKLRINYKNSRIYGELLTPEGHKAKTLVIGSHGFNGSMLYYKQGLGYRLSEEGYAVFVFDFINGSRHGKSGGHIEDMSVLDEKEQLKAVAEYFRNDYENIVLAGESQGGLVTTLAANEMADIKAVILYYPAYVAVDHAKQRMEKGETSHFGINFRSNYTREAASIDLETMIRGLKMPTILIHGNKDRVVDVGYAYWAKELNPEIELHIISNNDHGFDQKGREDAAEYVSDFLHKII